MKFVRNNETIVFAPKANDIIKYLNESELWKNYEHPQNPNLNGWEFIQKDDIGKKIIIPEYTIRERTAERFQTICTVESSLLNTDINETTAIKIATIKTVNS